MDGLRPGQPVVVISGGPDVDGDLVVRLVRSEGHFLLCTDSGGSAAIKLGLLPDLLIGDFDSIPADDLAWLIGRGCRRLEYPAEKDKTDTELALDMLLEAGAGPVVLTGAFGGRFDHALANLGLLAAFQARGLDVRIADAGMEAFVVVPGPARTVHGQPGDVVTLIAQTQKCRGLTLVGFRYPLHEATLAQGSTLGVSNELVAERGSISLTAGRAIVLVSRLRQHPPCAII